MNIPAGASVEFKLADSSWQAGTFDEMEGCRYWVTSARNGMFYLVSEAHIRLSV